MATIVLGAVGRFIGGPIGGAIGSVLGQVVDNSIFGSKTVSGPRLKELGVQTSGYGSAIPAVFGAVRIAGSVIWATDLIERKSKSGGGKGRPKTVQYAYSASFAVALSCRPALRIGRIWADGNLLRGASGDFKSSTGFRFYSGHSDQAPDPLIASDQDSGLCPAFRGLCYAVFEDMELADFGNRIPSLTFEVFERDGSVAVTEIAATISNGNITGASTESVLGYALEGSDVRSALAPLFENMPLTLRPNGNGLLLQNWWSGSESFSNITVAARSDGAKFDPPRRRRGPSGKLPQAIALRHYEPARDFQTGVQRSQISDTGRVAAQIDLPASLDANAARRLADLQLLQIHKSRDQWTGYAANSANSLNAGDYFREDSGAECWQISEIEHVLGGVRISAQRTIGIYPDRIYAADAGIIVPPRDTQAGQTRLVLMDLPALGNTDPAQPIVAIAAAGILPAWRVAVLSLQTANGLTEIGITAAPAVIGSAAQALAAHSPWLIDTHNKVTVQLLHGGMILPAGSGDPLQRDANLCWIGGEIIRAGTCTYLGENRYGLSMLQRGCYGTENAIGAHMPGEAFVLLETDTVATIDAAYTGIGTTLNVEALGIGDAVPAGANIQVTGHAIRPFAPVHASAQPTPSGGLLLKWVRRTRIDPGWQDNVDVPMIEDSLVFNIQIYRGGQVVASDTVLGTEWMIDASHLAAWGAVAGQLLTFEIAQIGRYNQSASVTLQYVVPI
jgi:Putative phage tail protein